MKKNLMLQNATQLSKSEMKNVKGGVAANSEGGCCIHYRSTSDNSYAGRNCGFSVEQAQNWYQEKAETSNGGFYVSGYCCASC